MQDQSQSQSQTEPDLRAPASMIAAVRLIATDDPVPARSRRNVEGREAAAVVHLLRADQEFAAAIPHEDAALAIRVLRARRLDLRAGQTIGTPWHEGAETDGAFAAVLVDGLVSRSLGVGARSSLELFGAGDVVNGEDFSRSPAGETMSWTVHQPTTVAVLDARFAAAARRWPDLWQVIARRYASRADRLASQLVGLQHSRVEDRLLTMLWQFAGRWGRVTTDGVVLPLALTHHTLGRLVAARRSTVSLALTRLGEKGAVTRRPDGSWVLAHDSRMPPLPPA